MITISVCMIVKNEEQVLDRCLGSLKGIWDELIIVDTGSSDGTVDIARRYTDLVYEFAWNGSFSDARNFAIDKATCEYIYSADADEILAESERDRFMALKQCLDPAVDVVQMYYGNQLENGTVYNYDKELRPKLFRRIRHYRFTEPIHETLDIEPVIFDSDIVITHKPEALHSSRDIEAFRKMIVSGVKLSKRLESFLHRELYMTASTEELGEFTDYLKEVTLSEDRSEDEISEACVLLARYFRLVSDAVSMFDNVVKVLAIGSTSEICCELGAYYMDRKDYDSAAVWFYNAYHECTPVMSIHAGTDIPLNGLADVYASLGNTELEAEYRKMASGASDEI